MATRAWWFSGCDRVVSDLFHPGLIAAGLLAAICLTSQARAQEAAVSPPPAASAAASATSSTQPNEPNLVKGRRAFQRNCTVCHGLRGEGGLGPPLKGIATRMSPEEITRQIMEPRGSMPRLYPSPIDAKLLIDLSAFLLQLH